MKERLGKSGGKERGGKVWENWGNVIQGLPDGYGTGSWSTRRMPDGIQTPDPQDPKIDPKIEPKTRRPEDPKIKPKIEPKTRRLSHRPED